MKKYIITAIETITREIIVEAEDFEDACYHWHDYEELSNIKIHEEWATHKVEEAKNVKEEERE